VGVKIGINGFGRIGRQVFKAIYENYAGEVELVAVNDLTDDATLAHLLKHDSVYGRFDAEIADGDNAIVVNGTEIRSLEERDPAKLPWGALGVDVVLESTGFFREVENDPEADAYKKSAYQHIDAGAKKVIISAPASGKADYLVTLVLGVNAEVYDPAKHSLISNASCTTNSLAPMCKVLHESFGITNGIMTTVHSYTSDQNLMDGPHKDLRRARHAAENIVPTTTGAASAIGVVIPDLDGRLDGIALRVPTPTGSVTDLVVNVEKSTSKAEVNAAFKVAAEGDLAGYLEYSEEPIVRTDIVGDPASCIFDSEFTKVIDGTLVKVLGWYDNEWGYSMRTAELLKMIGESV